MKKLIKISTDLTTRFKKTIISVDGKMDVSFINKFVDNEFLSVDSLALEIYPRDTTDIDMTANVKDVNGEEIEVTLQSPYIFVQPMRPTQQIFQLMIHSKVDLPLVNYTTCRYI